MSFVCSLQGPMLPTFWVFQLKYLQRSFFLRMAPLEVFELGIGGLFFPACKLTPGVWTEYEKERLRRIQSAEPLWFVICVPGGFGRRGGP